MMNERVKTSVWIAAAAAVACMADVSHANTATTTPTEQQLTQAVKAFLEDHGDLCVAKYTWPRDVNPNDPEDDTNDAIQLPVLERLGVVTSVEIPAPKETSTAATGAQLSAAVAKPTRRFSLTEKGRQYYVQKKHTVMAPHEQIMEHDADFCVAHLTLDKVIKWSPPDPVHNQLETVVRYTYHVKAADWMSEPEAQKVFPIVDRTIRGEGSRMMSATVALREGKWVPVIPGQ